MRVYLAAGFGGQEDVRALAYHLRERGIIPTSSWLSEPVLKHDNEEEHRRWMRGLANEDVEDIRRADGVVELTYWPSQTGGRHTELGIAIGMTVAGQRRKMVVVGVEEENIFQHRAEVVFLAFPRPPAYEGTITRAIEFSKWAEDLSYALMETLETA